jgi:ankyrin repeat protein
MIKNRFFISFLILSFTCNTHTMKRRFRENKSSSAASFANLPSELRQYFIELLSITSTAETIQEAGKIINALAQTNQELNELINKPKFCLMLIKNLAKQFHCSDQEATEALQTEEAKKRLEIQQKFFDACDHGNIKTLNLLYKEYQEYVDLNFIFYYFANEKKIETTLLMIAAENNNCPLIEILLKYGANINRTDSDRDTALTIAAINKNLNAMQCLLNNSDIAIDQKNNVGATVLMQAIPTDNCSIIQTLLNYGANINATSFDGITPLIAAAFDEKVNAIKCLLKNPIIVIDQQNNYGLTALIGAIYKKNKLIIKLLLDAGADPELTTYNDFTPLQAAQKTGDQEIIDLIQNAIDKKHGKK